MSHAGFVHMGHSLQFLRLCFGLRLLLVGLSGMLLPNGEVVVGASMAAIGGFMMWTARIQGLTISGSGDKIVFATKSVSQAELSKILTVINTG